MNALRARMKPGVRSIIIDCAIVPEYPKYWCVPASASAAVEMLVQDGQIEYEPAYVRAPMVEPALQTVDVAASRPVMPAKAFKRTGR